MIRLPAPLRLAPLVLALLVVPVLGPGSGASSRLLADDAPAAVPAAPAPAPAAAAATVIPIARPQHPGPVEFHREVLPVLQANCLPCHNRNTPKGDLNLETPAAMIKGGESGPSIVPGKASESLLLRVATHEAKPRMPPKDNKVNAVNLSPAQLGLLALWIDQGAPAGSAAEAPIPWQPVPTNFAPIFAVAVSPDAQLAACGRGNRIHLYRVAGNHFLQNLSDTSLPDGAAQRDLVNALAFSPDGRQLAAGGYREIRIWERQDPAPTPAFPLHQPTAAALSPDRSTLAVAQADGTLETLRLADGSPIARLGSLQPAPRWLEFSADGSRLAALGRRGKLTLFSLKPEALVPRDIALEDVEVAGWIDQGRAFATAQGTSPIVRWHRLPTAATNDLTLERELTGHTQRITAILDGAPLGAALLTGSEDGTVRIWSTDPKAESRLLTVGSPVVSLALLPGNKSIAIATRTGGTRLWSIEGTPKQLGELAGDARLAETAAVAERRLAAGRGEVEYQKGALKRAEEDQKKRTEELTKATEKAQGTAKALAEKRQALTREEQNAATATREKGELTTALDQARTRQEASKKTAETTRTALRETVEGLTLARLSADQAVRAAADLEKLLADLTGKSDEPTLLRAREAAASALKNSETRKTQAEQAKTANDKAIDELALRAREEGEAKSLFDRANTELPPRIKKAEEQLAAATKATETLKTEGERARIQNDTAEADVQLARRNLEAATKAIEDARTAIAAAERETTLAESLAKQSVTRRDAAAGRGHVWIATAPDGKSLITLDDEQRLAAWDIATLRPGPQITLPPHLNRPIAAGSDGEVRFLDTAALVRHPLESRWNLARVLGTGGPDSRIVDRVNALSFSPDGRWLASGGGEPSRSGEIKLWDPRDGSLVRDLGLLHSDCVLGLAFSPQGDLLASGGADRFLRLSDPRTGKGVRNFEGHTHHVLAVAWRADGRVLLSGGGEGMVKIWNRLTGDRLRNVDNFGKEVTGVAALGNAAEFLAVSGAGTARVFKEDGNQIRTLPAGSTFLSALAVSPDGRLAVGGGDDGVLRLWQIGDGAVLGENPSGPALARN